MEKVHIHKKVKQLKQFKK